MCFKFLRSYIAVARRGVVVLSAQCYAQRAMHNMRCITCLCIHARYTVYTLAQARGGIGVTAIKFKNPRKGAAPDSLCALRVVSSDDQVLLSTVQGTIVRQSASRVSAQGRTATGVRVQRLDSGDEISTISIIPAQLIDVSSDSEIEGLESDADDRVEHAEAVPV
jgi:DNA gyrase C-terminal domain, beta-propeller